MPMAVAIDTSRISTQPLFAKSQRQRATQTAAMNGPAGTLNGGRPSSRVVEAAVFSRQRKIGKATQVLTKTNSLVITVNFTA
jgi:hypothetical protein